jgi:hypothetical protein
MSWFTFCLLFCGPAAVSLLADHAADLARQLVEDSYRPATDHL